MKRMVAWLPRSRAARRRRDRRAPQAAATVLQRVVGGSYAAHESLQGAALQYLELHGVPAISVSTGPKVRPRPGGGFDLKANPAQKGFSDIAAALPPDGRLVLIECKTGSASRSAEQIALQEHFQSAGALCVVIRNALDLAPYVQRSRFQDRRTGG